MLAAEHILLVTQGMNPTQKAEVKKKADALRARVNAANFADLAKTNSQDPGSARNGGSLGIFPAGQMVPEFEKALVALKPGEISPVIETSYGYHIIRRPTYDQIKGQLLQASKGRSVAVAESTYLARLEQAGKIEIKKGAAATVRALGNDPDAYRRDSARQDTGSVSYPCRVADQRLRALAHGAFQFAGGLPNRDGRPYFPGGGARVPVRAHQYCRVFLD